MENSRYNMVQNRDFYEYDDDYNYPNDKDDGCCRCTWKKCLIWTGVTILCVLLFLFILIWVIFPLIFMSSLGIQTFIMFPNFDQPSNPEYDNFEKYGAVGVRNLYVNVTDSEKGTIQLGVWHVLPSKLMNQTIDQPNFDYDAALNSAQHDVIIYFHGNSGTRIYPLPTYEVLRKYYHVLAVDYRSYGDSTQAELTEKNVVQDLVQFYQWVRSNTKANIYVWAHSLGTSLGTHTLARLNELKIVPMGLILEAPFSTMREELAVHPIGKVFSWLAYFDATIRDPLEENGFHFWTTTYIQNISCPIMILHAEDDSIIPYSLSMKLADVANTNRTIETMGNVTYHLIESKHRANHMEINKVPELPEYIEEFRRVCQSYNLMKG